MDQWLQQFSFFDRLHALACKKWWRKHDSVASVH